jgi:hypothetical protein
MTEDELLAIKTRASKIITVTVKLVNRSFEAFGKSHRNIYRAKTVQEALVKLDKRDE